MDIKLATIQRLSLQIVGLTFQKFKIKDPEFLSKIDIMTTEINKLCDSTVLEIKKNQLQTRALNCKVETLRKALQRSGNTPESSPVKRTMIHQHSEGEESPAKQSSIQYSGTLPMMTSSFKEKLEGETCSENQSEKTSEYSDKMGDTRSDDDNINTPVDGFTEEEKNIFEEVLDE